MSLRLENIDLRVNGVAHLDRVSLDLKPGTLYTILGRTLSGKTTLLRTIAGLQVPQAGTMTLKGEDFSKRPIWKRGVAMVYQQFINYPHLDVLANVAFPLRRAGVGREEAHRRAREVLDRVGLSDFIKRRPSALSGGQQQRVALARALVKNADILLLDEPLVNLDYKLREQLREEFINIFEDQGDAIVIYTTTDPAEAIQLGHELIVMNEGAVIQQGNPLDVFRSPTDICCAEIINDPPMNIFDGIIHQNVIRLQGGVEFPAPDHMSDLPDGEYRFGLRAMDLVLGQGFESEVELSEICGSQTIVHLQSAIGPFIVYETGVNHYNLGNRLGVEIQAERMYTFLKEGALISAPPITAETWR